MKPIIITVPLDSNGKIVVTKEELENMIFDAYEQGKKDSTYTPISYPINSPPTSYYWDQTYITSSDIKTFLN